MPSFGFEVKSLMAFALMKNQIVEKNPNVKTSIAKNGASSLNLRFGSSGSLNKASHFSHFRASLAIRFPQNGQLICSVIKPLSA